MKRTRAVVYFKGRVQGVGFRYTCRELSKRFLITGYVRNLEDGRVMMEIEGERAEIESFLSDLEERTHLKIFIRERETEWREAKGDWTNFHIEP